MEVSEAEPNIEGLNKAEINEAELDEAELDKAELDARPIKESKCAKKIIYVYLYK
jgi:hypothetical protein